MTNMQFIDLKRQYEKIQDQVDERIKTVLAHGKYIMGPEVAELEEKLAHYVGVKHCIGVANGTDALLLAMMALGIQPGDEVITTPFTFIANAEMIALLQAKPVFVDIDPDTYNITAETIAQAITPRTKAIMVVDLYGQCADYDAINALANQHNLPVIEDAAQSFGATYRGRKACGLATIGTTSFFPSKPLGCYGDGGACFTDDDDLAQILRELRVHGQERRYVHTRIGINGRLDTLQAAVLLAKLPIFDQEVEARNHAAMYYSELLHAHFKVPTILPENTSVFAQYTIEVRERDKVIAALQKAGIPTAVHYPIPTNQQPAFAELCQSQVLPVAEKAAQSVLSLPMHPYLTNDDIEKVVKAVIEANS